ncbi:hypothetical protein CELL_00618 [Cellulomonas sp. T2.31MG-18]|uniref:flagellar hook-associated protein FlgK n=1 Tax=Cellulomonas sp. T2.31MG-18 TaxID=3157619 RepID=UPI0035E802FE
MASTFSGLGTALSSLIAQRQALTVAGQNIANANTPGYTRQRVDLASVPGAQVPSMFATSDGVGMGTQVTGISRLSDQFLDTQVRSHTGTASFLAARADAYTTLETSLGEPSTTGLSSQLSTFWAGWHDVANSPDDTAARTVLLDDARQVTETLHARYGDLQTQWQQARTTTGTLVDQTNTLASNVADLNKRILDITNSGGSANELADQRDQLVTQLSGLVGATARQRADGQLDVMVGGNMLVSGDHVRQLAVSGPAAFSGATGDPSAVPPVVAAAVRVVWADAPTQDAALSGGRVAGLLTVLAPPDASGTGGMLTEAAASLDTVAQALADGVNALHGQGQTVAQATAGSTAPGGTDFFAISGGSAAAGISVALSTPDQIAVAAPGSGPLDGSVGQKIAALADSSSGPGAVWAAAVAQVGSMSASASSRSGVAEQARASAETAQQSGASVDTDEETVSMLAFQRAYQGAARVITAMDEMLDTLINRTGTVGR